jgi:hypothetical protein
MDGYSDWMDHISKIDTFKFYVGIVLFRLKAPFTMDDQKRLDRNFEHLWASDFEQMSLMQELFFCFIHNESQQEQNSRDTYFH